MSDGFVGVSLYHRLEPSALVERAADQLLALLGGGPDLQLQLGDEALAPATAGTLRGFDTSLATQGPDRPLSVADDVDQPRRYLRLVDPRDTRPRAPSPEQVVAVLPARDFDVDAFAALSNELDARYGFVTWGATFDAAWDEAVWPEHDRLRSDDETREHPAAWIQLMRSFGRHDLGVRVPDIYWGNLFGFQVINELRRSECWERLEQVADLHYLDGGSVIFFLSDEPAPASEHDGLRSQVGDLVLAPLGSMWRALDQGLQGDTLLLETLVATGDQRLALGLAYPAGLDAFRSLLNVSAEEVETVDDALALLASTSDDRPRCYGEPWNAYTGESSDVHPGEEQEPQQEAAGEDAERPPVSRNVTADSGDPAQWSVDWISRVSVRMELGTLSFAANETGLELDVTIVNALPRPVGVRGLQVVHLTDNGNLLGVWGGRREARLDPLEGRVPISLAVPQARTNQRLLLQSTVEYSCKISVADLVFEKGVARVMGVEADGSVHSSWPADVRVTTSGGGLAVAVTNTGQEAWCGWHIALEGEALERTGVERGTLKPSETAWAVIDTAGLDSTCQLVLSIEVASDLVLAEFEAKAV